MAKIFQTFTNDDTITGQTEVITGTAWSDNSATLSTFFTSSTQSGSSGFYYLDVYNKDINSDTTAVSQFSVAYGNIDGSGSLKTTGGRNGDSPTKAIFSQYKQLLLPEGTTTWTTTDGDGNSRSVKEFYAINFNRARCKEALDPGNWELTLSSSVATVTNALHLIDNSADTTGTTGIAGKTYEIISGSIGNAGVHTGNQTRYGSFYPEQGIMILDAGLISSSSMGILAGHGRVSGSDAVDKPAESAKFYNHIKGGASFKARNAQQLTCTYYFCRVKNQEFNYSNNPSFVTGSNGTLKHATMKQNPQTYITTVGLYNNMNELLAVAKLSKPLLKSFSREALIKVKLEY